MFCRHNRLEINCPICAPKKVPSAKARGTVKHVGRPKAPGAAKSGARRGVVTRKLARAEDDGYRIDVAPGLKATADAERLADALAIAAARLEYPGPYPMVAEVEPQDAREIAFLLAMAGPDDAERHAAILAGDRTGVEALQDHRGTWYAADASLSPQRRFSRTFDSLRLPGFGRAARYDFLMTLAAAGVYELEPDALFVDVKANDATTLAAKRALNSGDAMLLERRAKTLAEAAGVPLAALDRGLVLWDSTEPLEAPEDHPVRAALGV
ncbi:MAG: hypothetical protein QOF76_513 [Solirubrobacteraceae bacterium]|nr:hypothetical protein [Solirubrobacteraceae bacterium]